VLLSRVPEIGRDSLVLAPSYVIPGLASLISIPILYATLGPSQYGVLALILAVANGVPQLTTSWLEAVVVRFAHRPGFEWSARAVASAVLASCTVGGILAALLIPTADPSIVATTALLSGIIGAYLVVTAGLQSMMRFGAVSRGAVVRAVLATIGSVAAAGTVGTAAGTSLGFALGFAVGTAVLIVGMGRPDARSIAAAGPARSSNRDGASLGNQRDIASYGFRSLAVAGSLYLLSVSDRFVLSSVRPLQEVGLYAATYGIVDLVFRLAPSLLIVVERPRVYRAWDRGDRRLVSSLVVSIAATLSWILAALAIALILVSTSSSLLPVDARLAGPIAIGVAAFVTSTTFGLIYAADLRLGRLALHLGLASLLSIGLNLALARSLGAYGAAVVTAIGYMTLLALNLWALRHVVDIASKAGMRVWAGCFIVTAFHCAVAGTEVWPAAALIATVVLLALLPTLVGSWRNFGRVPTD
jgi:O-antigen/teichoic acid export membrane protein